MSYNNRNFIGTHDGEIDDKGRCCLPKKYVIWLMDETNSGATLFMSPSRRLLMADQVVYNTKMAEYLEGIHNTYEREEWALYLHALSYRIPVHDNGSFTIPPHLVEIAGLKKEVFFVGCGSHLAIVPSDKMNLPVLNTSNLYRQSNAALPEAAPAQATPIQVVPTQASTTQETPTHAGATEMPDCQAPQAPQPPQAPKDGTS